MNKMAIAIDLGGTFIKGALVDRAGRIVSPTQTPTGKDLSPKAVIDRLVDVIQRLRAVAEKDGGNTVIGVGLGCPGGVYRDRARVSQSPNFPQWRDVQLRGPLEERLGLPVVLENDANVAALGEQWLGVGRDVDSLVLLTLGTGIGGGVILNGRIWQGEWGMAGEIGHITVERDGPLCGCGNRGCLEAVAAGPAIVRRAKEAIARGEGRLLLQMLDGDIEKVTPLAVYDAARQGGAVCENILHEAAQYIGIVIASVLNVLNVPLFVIGGGISAAFDVLGPIIRQEVRARAYRVPGENVRIERAALGNDAGALGAGLLVFQEFDTTIGKQVHE